MPSIGGPGGPGNIKRMEPKAPHHARENPVNTLESDPVNGSRIDLKATYTSLEVEWTGGSAFKDGDKAGGGYEVFFDGKPVDLGEAHVTDWGDRQSAPSASKWLEIPKGGGDASIEIKKDGETVAQLAIDKQGVMKRVALGIADFRDEANIFAGMDDGFLGAMYSEDAGGLAKRAGVHLIKGLTPDLMIQGFADGIGIEKSVPKALGFAARGLVGDVVEASFQGIAALTNGVGAAWKAIT